MMYMIVDKANHLRIFLAEGDGEDEAWGEFLKAEYEYVRNSEGAFSHRGRWHKDLQDAMDVYGLIQHEDGSVIAATGEQYPSLGAALNVYNVKAGSDGSYVSYDLTFPNLSSALRGLVGHCHRLWIQQVELRTQKLQNLFTSEDLDENVSWAEIACEHRNQALRYQSLGQNAKAIRELKEYLKHETDRRSVLRCVLDIANLYSLEEKLSSALSYYRKAWRMSIEADNQAHIAQLLASTLRALGRTSEANKFAELIEDLD